MSRLQDVQIDNPGKQARVSALVRIGGQERRDGESILEILADNLGFEVKLIPILEERDLADRISSLHRLGDNILGWTFDEGDRETLELRL